MTNNDLTPEAKTKDRSIYAALFSRAYAVHRKLVMNYAVQASDSAPKTMQAIRLCREEAKAASNRQTRRRSSTRLARAALLSTVFIANPVSYESMGKSAFNLSANFSADMISQAKQGLQSTRTAITGPRVLTLNK